MKDKYFKYKITIPAIIVILISISGVYYYGKPSNAQNPPQSRQTVNDEVLIKNIISTFEQNVEQKNPYVIQSLFTPPQISEEVNSYKSLLGQDTGTGPRLFNTASTNFNLISWNIARRVYPDNSELISLIGNKYMVVVQEKRSIYNNVTMTWHPPLEIYLVFEIVKYNKHWMIDKYYFQKDTSSLTDKYNGLGG